MNEPKEETLFESVFTFAAMIGATFSFYILALVIVGDALL